MSVGFQRTAPIDQVQLVVAAKEGSTNTARPHATNSSFGFGDSEDNDASQPGSASLKGTRRDSVEARRHVWGRHRTPSMQDAIAKTANIGWTTL